MGFDLDKIIPWGRSSLLIKSWKRPKETGTSLSGSILGKKGFQVAIEKGALNYCAAPGPGGLKGFDYPHPNR